MEPENQGNIGAVARVMKNFGFGNLVLVNPCEIGEEAISRAKHAKDVLLGAKVVDNFEWDKYNLIVGTTGIVTDEYNVRRTAMTPEQLRENLKGEEGVALLFGREGEGLRNDELERCDIVVHIPTNPEYPVLNLSHSVAVVLYELSKGRYPSYELATRKQKEVLLKIFKEALERTDYKEYRRKKTFISLKNLIGRSMLSAREANTLIGYFRKVLKR